MYHYRRHIGLSKNIFIWSKLISSKDIPLLNVQNVLFSRNLLLFNQISTVLEPDNFSTEYTIVETDISTIKFTAQSCIVAKSMTIESKDILHDILPLNQLVLQQDLHMNKTLLSHDILLLN
jgi:hypothetical protein